METKTTVKSSNLATVSYDKLRHTLKIKFKSGSIYEYYNVPEETFLDLIITSSPGKYFNKYVKKMDYRFIQIK